MGGEETSQNIIVIIIITREKKKEWGDKITVYCHIRIFISVYDFTR